MESTTYKNKSDTYLLGLIFGGMGIFFVVAARMVLWLHPPLPKCFFKEITGYPCPTCGVTRCLIELSQFHIWNAFLMNPLFFLTGVGVGIFAIYSFGVYFLNMPKISFTWTKRRTNIARVLVIAAILINWGFLIAVNR